MKIPTIAEIKEKHFTTYKHEGKKGKKAKERGNTILREIAYYFAKFLLITPITANQVTVILMIGTGILAVVLFSLGDYWYTLIGVLLLILNYIFDHVDGIIARYRNQSSKAGDYLDYIADKTIVYPLVFLGLGFGALRNTGNIVFFIFGILASYSFLAYGNIDGYKFSTFYKNKIFGKQEKSPSTKKTPLGIYQTIKPIFAMRNIMWAIVFGAIINITQYVIIFYGTTLTILFILKAYHEFKVVKTLE